jgi:hypothetical protein
MPTMFEVDQSWIQITNDAAIGGRVRVMILKQVADVN